MLQLVWTGLGQGGAPAGGVTVAAMDHWQVLAFLVGLAQIVVVSQHRLRIHLGDHAPQFTLPDLHLDLEEEVLVSWLSGMRNQGQQAGQPQENKGLAHRLTVPLGQATSQQRQQVRHQHRLRPQPVQVTQQVLEREVALQSAAQFAAPVELLNILR